MNPLATPSAPRLLCPYLPQTFAADLHAGSIQAFKKERSERFYMTLLAYAQKLWLEGLPAQSLLMINRALSCALPEIDLAQRHASPYQAVAWFLQNRQHGEFIGNPRRHYQHLATRMVEPNKSLRVARAWACWYLAKGLLPDQDFPPDVLQIWKERLVEPTFDQVSSRLRQESPSNDWEAWRIAVRDAYPITAPRGVTESVWSCAPIRDSAELRSVTRLAHEIWPECYGNVLSPDQIAYMLEQGYSHEALLKQWQSPKVEFWLTHPTSSSEADGFFCFETQADQNAVFLHKLYLHPQARGSGRGHATLNWLQAHFADRGMTSLKLRVNKSNYTAITAYTRAGMHITGTCCTDIGHGYVMDDYELEKRW